MVDRRAMIRLEVRVIRVPDTLAMYLAMMMLLG
jgi:hypothetical protein